MTTTTNQAQKDLMNKLNNGLLLVRSLIMEELQILNSIADCKEFAELVKNEFVGFEDDKKSLLRWVAQREEEIQSRNFLALFK